MDEFQLIEFHLTDEEIRVAYHRTWATPNPHVDGLKAIAEAQTSKIEKALKCLGWEIRNAS